jgi:hypothetical protein
MPALLITLPLAALLAGIGGQALRMAARQWSGRGPAHPMMERMRANSALDTESRLAFDRGLLPFGFMMLCLAIFIASLGIALPHMQQGRVQSAALSALAGLSFLALIVSVGLYLSVKYFNRPKMLVAPSLRDEPGVIAGRRRRRESLRARNT